MASNSKGWSMHVAFRAAGWLCLSACVIAQERPPVCISGIYPHLAMFNDEDECGVGAVVPWADRLWAVTYAPHKPEGSTDKLYEITTALEQITRDESVGGTPANRMIHPESNQLFIGPYVIDAARQVRVIPYSTMFGRPTGNARHLFDPVHKIYCATMEEGLYEIDVDSLAVTELWTDEQRPGGRYAQLPGYHGKGLYSGHGRVIYANNGEHGPAALTDPETPSGCLAQWDGRSAHWEVVRRNQFTDVTGPVGISGTGSASDPVWSIGWDHRSLILMCLDDAGWHSWRLPKASRSYDGAHGWNTEWPRIRDVGEPDLLMTMHGLFWKFPRGFCSTRSAGIVPRSRYLKVVGDFCRWEGRIVCGCDDTARSEFLNKRAAKGVIAAPQSQSNLWFLALPQLDQFGPVIAAGGVWLHDAVRAAEPSEPFLLGSTERCLMHLAHQSAEPVRVMLEVDRAGNGEWIPLRNVQLEPHGYRWLDLAADRPATWIRLVTDRDVERMTAWFDCSQPERRDAAPAAIFRGVGSAAASRFVGGTVRARGGNYRTLYFLASRYTHAGPQELGLYELDANLALRAVDDRPTDVEFERRGAAIPVGVLTQDAASVLYVDDRGNRWRLPRGDRLAEPEAPSVPQRVCREVATERDLFNAGGIFYELPAENAGGFAHVRPVATHGSQITDYCSWRGLLVLSGVAVDAAADNARIVRSTDGAVALWLGALDDLWQFGKPRGVGGPWYDTEVAADTPSDRYLLGGFDRRTLTLAHADAGEVEFTVECDLTGTGCWVVLTKVTVPAGVDRVFRFPDGYHAQWLRLHSNRTCRATAQLVYE